LVDQLLEAGAVVATTDLLVEEVREHALWARSKIGTGASGLTVDTLSAATGRAGQRSNLFLEGYLREIEAGTASLDFGAYIASVCDSPRAARGRFKDFSVAVESAIESAGVTCVAFARWRGFEDELWAERDERQGRIAELRKERASYTHDRQVRAEAEVLLIVEGIRAGTLEPPDADAHDGYFVSNTRVIDRVAGPGLPITMQPDAVRLWLSTVAITPPEELGFLINGLQWELSERGLQIVDRALLQVVFAPLVAASEADLEEEAAAHRALVGTVYGESPERAFDALDPLDLPVALSTALAQRVDELESTVATQRRTLDATAKAARISEKDREALARLEQQEKDRRLRGRSRKRASHSRRRRRKK